MTPSGTRRPRVPSLLSRASLATALLLSLLLGLPPSARAQTPDRDPPPAAALPAISLPDAPQPTEITLRGTPRRLLSDQQALWSSPLHLRPRDAEWLLPLGLTTGLLLGSDSHTMLTDVHIRPADQKHFATAANAGLFGLAAIPSGMFLWSLHTNAPQARETSLLTGEALGNTLFLTEMTKILTRRNRPDVDNSRGRFFASGINSSSFPSNHAAAAWAIASVVGEEYPGWLSRTAVYSTAAGVSLSRILADGHFPSDVVVGSAAGWLIGRYVYRAHHNYTLTPFTHAPLPDELLVPRPARRAPLLLPPDPIPRRAVPPTEVDIATVDPDTLGSTNVPMDSWIYPALERLAALGFIPGQSASIRPWTRAECLRQLRLAEDLATDSEVESPSLLHQARLLLADLHAEFAAEPSRNSLDLESVYTRAGTIAGPALTDSFHLGQTWWNDLGRPLGRGTSALAGFSVRGHDGRLFFYDRQELQHGPGTPADTPALTALFNTLDAVSAGQPLRSPAPAIPAFDRMRPIELYAGIAAAGNSLSLGKQELFWGPTRSGPLSFSSNAEPTWNLRFVATRPHPVPLLPGLTYRFDIVLGKLSGHTRPARPWFNGQKASFNFGDTLELAFTRWSIFQGVGHPFTVHNVKQNFLSFNSTGAYAGNGYAAYGDPLDPGDRKSNFDFRLRPPGLRKIVTLYADAYSDDDPSPIDAPRRALWSPGIYFARLPFLPQMDLRVEAVSSTGLAHEFDTTHFLINGQYPEGNTNKGFLLGNAAGRDARVIEARAGYWLSARTRLEAGYRHNKGGSLFLPGGSTIHDGFLNAQLALGAHWQAQLFAQHEHFLIPAYLPGRHSNTSGWLQLTWQPTLHLHR